jgi:hypothetical protein
MKPSPAHQPTTLRPNRIDPADWDAVDAVRDRVGSKLPGQGRPPAPGGA